MAIPISEYISITPKVLTKDIGDRDFSALIFTKTAMASTAPSTLKAAYDGKKVVSLGRDEVAQCFSDSSFLAFCKNYFSYTGGTKRPSVINIALVGSDETASAAYSRVTGGTDTVDAFCNFGMFYFYDSTFTVGVANDGGLLDVSTANEGNEYGWVLCIKTDAENQSEVSRAVGSAMLTHITHASWEPLAWYASVDYSADNAAGTIDYKQFAGSTATVKSKSAKSAADALNVNYIGLVQTYGTGISFYQTGVNADGTDLGVVRDMCWLNSEIVKGYFNLQTSVQKVPANATGVAQIRAVVTEVALRAIDNGVILNDKPFTVDIKQSINEYAGTDGAADVVSSTGYYISCALRKEDGKYLCQYTLIYAKGDHIVKVSGLEVLA